MEHWWRIKVRDRETNTTTTLDRFGDFDDEMIQEIEEDGWEIVSAVIDTTE